MFNGPREVRVKLPMLCLAAVVGLAASSAVGKQPPSPSPHPWLGAKDLRAFVTVRGPTVAVDEQKLEQAGVKAGSFLPPRRIAEEPPIYPESARQARAEGRVALECLIRENGKVDACKVIQGVHPDLDKAAFRAIVKWRYEPAKLDGIALAILVTFEMNFRLR